jgi:hypothetical protein
MFNFCSKIFVMKHLLTASMYLAFVYCLSCNVAGDSIKGNGTIVTENRSISNADNIKVLGDMEVIIDSGAAAVKVEGDQNILPYILTESNNNRLEIKSKNNVRLHTRNPVRVYVTTPSVQSVGLSGSGNVTSSAKFSSPQPVSLDISGSGDIKMRTNAPNVNARISGSGNLTISGETRDVEVRISGSGDYNGMDLKAETASVHISGSGDASLYAEDRLEARISGSGNVRYKGKASVDKKISGSGNVRKAD